MRCGSVDGALQKLVPLSPRQHKLYLSHHPPLEGHPNQRLMYDNVRWNYCWQSMAKDSYHTVSDCHSCARNGVLLRHKLHLQLFLATRPLEVFAMNISEPLPKTAKENKYVVLITDRSPKLTRAILSAKITTTNVANIYIQGWVLLYGISSYILTDNSTQFVSNFFFTLYNHFDTKYLTKTTFRRHTNEQVRRYNETVVKHLRHYVADHQREWDTYIQALAYVKRAGSHVHQHHTLHPRFDREHARTDKVRRRLRHGFGYISSDRNSGTRTTVARPNR